MATWPTRLDTWPCSPHHTRVSSIWCTPSNKGNVAMARFCGSPTGRGQAPQPIATTTAPATRSPVGEKHTLSPERSLLGSRRTRRSHVPSSSEVGDSPHFRHGVVRRGRRIDRGQVTTSSNAGDEPSPGVGGSMELGGRLSPPVDQLDPFDVHTGV